VESEGHLFTNSRCWEEEKKKKTQRKNGTDCFVDCNFAKGGTNGRKKREKKDTGLLSQSAEREGEKEKAVLL